MRIREEGGEEDSWESGPGSDGESEVGYETYDGCFLPPTSPGFTLYSCDSCRLPGRPGRIRSHPTPVLDLIEILRRSSRKTRGSTAGDGTGPVGTVGFVSVEHYFSRPRAYPEVRTEVESRWV